MEAMQALREHLEKRPSELRRMKERGVKIIGYTPGGYMPEDLVYAAGAVPVGLIRGGDHEAVAESGVYLPRFLDTFCRSQIGYKMLGEEPLYEMVDLLVVPVTDNNMRAIAEAWSFYTNVEVFRFGVPHDKEEDAYQYYLEGLRMLKDKLERFTGNKIGESELRKQINLSNRMWEALEKISLLRKKERPPISGAEFARLNHASFYADKPTFVNILESLYNELKDKKGPSPISRVLVTGSTLAMGDYKIMDLTEGAGGAVVIEELAEGMRHYWERVRLNGDLLEALADRYFRRRVPPAWFRPSRERIDFVMKLAKDFAVDGIIWYQLMYRDGYDIQSFYFEKIVEKEMGLRTLKVQSDYDRSEIGPLRTRLETFVETIKRR